MYYLMTNIGNKTKCSRIQLKVFVFKNKNWREKEELIKGRHFQFGPFRAKEKTPHAGGCELIGVSFLEAVSFQWPQFFIFGSSSIDCSTKWSEKKMTGPMERDKWRANECLPFGLGSMMKPLISRKMCPVENDNQAECQHIPLSSNVQTFFFSLKKKENYNHFMD